MSREEKRGWLGSVLVHGIAAAILFFWTVDESMTQPEFISVSWGQGTTMQSIPSPPSSAPASGGLTSSKPANGETPVNLPERRVLADQDVLPVARAKKLDVHDTPQHSRVRQSEGIQGQKGLAIGTGEKGQFTGKGGTGGYGNMPIAGMGGEGSGVGKGVAFSMEWSGGGTRKLLTGSLPHYPAGVNVEAQIKLESVVLPGGGVKSVKPVQKGNTELEEAAMKEVRRWMFEPLPKSTPQREQSCVITFNFILH